MTFFSKRELWGPILVFAFALPPNSVFSETNHDDFACPPSEEGFFPHPENCEKYYGCYSHIRTLHICDDQLLFDLNYRGCNWPEMTNCQNRIRPSNYPNTRTPPPAGEPTTAKPFECPQIDEDKLYPDPSDCSYYYRCVHQISFHYKCAPPLVFDEIYRSCEYKEHVDCGGIMRLVISDGEIESAIKNLGMNKLLVIYFYLPWCGSCQKMNPSVDAIATKYSHVLFIQANAEKCPMTTKKHHIFKVPLFLLFNNRVKVDRVEGASPSELEAKIRRNLVDIQSQKNGPPSIPGPSQGILTTMLKMTDLTPYLNKPQCRCINDLVPTPFQSFLEGKKLVSGKGVGRMILVYAFKEKMVITALKIKAPAYSGPKVLRFFVNLSKVLDFAVVSQMSSTQEIQLTDDDLNGERSIEFTSGGLVGVDNLQIYIPENMTKNRKTEIESLTIIGAPLSMTNYANMDLSTNTKKTISMGAQSANSGTSQVTSMPNGRLNANEGSSIRRKVDTF